MLRFQSPPDAVFLAILHYAIETMLDELENEDLMGEEEWKAQYPNAAKVFTIPIARDTLKALLKASKAPGLYQITDYHWLLLYDALRVQIDILNDLARDQRNGLWRVGPYWIGQVDLGDAIDGVFWDIDFLIEGELIASLSPEQRQSMGMNPELFGLSQGMIPHPEELKTEFLEDEAPEPSEAPVPPEGSIIRKYPNWDEGTEENYGVVFEPGPSKAGRMSKPARRKAGRGKE